MFSSIILESVKEYIPNSYIENNEKYDFIVGSKVKKKLVFKIIHNYIFIFSRINNNDFSLLIHEISEKIKNIKVKVCTPLRTSLPYGLGQVMSSSMVGINSLTMYASRARMAGASRTPLSSKPRARTQSFRMAGQACAKRRSHRYPAHKTPANSPRATTCRYTESPR